MFRRPADSERRGPDAQPLGKSIRHIFSECALPDWPTLLMVVVPLRSFGSSRTVFFVQGPRLSKVRYSQITVRFPLSPNSQPLRPTRPHPTSNNATRATVTKARRDFCSKVRTIAKKRERGGRKREPRAPGGGGGARGGGGGRAHSWLSTLL